MKKFLCATLAAAMALSMASVAFAAKYEDKVEVNPVTYAKDKRFYFDHSYAIADVMVNDPDVIKDIKVSYDIDMGEEFVEDIKLVPVKDAINKSHYALKVYFAEEAKNVNHEDVIGTVTLKAKSNYELVNAELNADGDNELVMDLGMEISNYDANKMDEIYDDVCVYNFDDIDDDEHEISLFAESGRFVVDVRGQGKVTIKSTVKYSKGIEALDNHNDIAYTYYNGNEVKFNKMGTLYLNAKDTDVLYGMKDGKLVKIANNYDEDEEAFVLRTREIGSYVVAEKELDIEAINAALNPAPEAPVAPVVPSNPSTGAAC